VRKLALLLGLTLVGVMLFASAAEAQQSSSASASTSGCTTSSTPGGGFVTRCVDFAASASPSASAATAAQYQYASTLPSTGGVSPASLLAIFPAILLVGGGLLSARLIRRR
jgi:LPXTG-motif cell wall-anchored protein